MISVDEALNVIVYQLGMLLVIQLIKFTVDYCVKPLKHWISSMFPEDWSVKK